VPDDIFPGRAPAIGLAGPPRLLVLVDTEEEFDWDRPLSRASTGVTAMRHIGRTHRICARFGLRPTYVIDYPVASQEAGYDNLRSWVHAGECVVGAHLHPWVTPPFEEEVNGRNSFACNLPPALQVAKIRALTASIEANLAVAPRTFKAGRYGIGSPALDVIEQLGFDVDASVIPHWDFSDEEGPDFSRYTSHPFWFGRRRMLEAPCTAGLVGWGRRAGVPLRQAAERLKRLHAPGILARLGVVDRVLLSPELSTLDEMIAVTRALIGDGVSAFSFTFHSPSAEPGHTPYVRSDSDLQDFLRRIERYFEFFFGEIGGVATTPEDLRRELLRMGQAH
jgi:hypothetical protein